MYIPDHFKETNPACLATLLRDYPFGTLITVHDGLPFVSHIPFLHEHRSDGTQVLRGHVAKSNPQWHDLEENQTALVVFQGPHAYISPSWYESPGVPTWNYAVVHIYGKARLLQDEASLEKLITELTAVYESNQINPWKPQLSGEQRTRLLGSIVGFEIEAQDIQAKFKLSQNRSRNDQQAVIDQLAKSPVTAPLALLMQENAKGRA